MDEIVNFSIDEAGTIIVPDSYVSVPKLSDTNKIGVRQIILGDGVKQLNPQFACNAKLLNRVGFSTGIQFIPKEAFKGCVRLECVDLPPNLQLIDSKSFMDCGLIYIKIGSLVSKINDYAFANCNLMKIDFEENSQLKIIGKNAFAENRKLKAVMLPDNLEELSQGAFSGCVNLKLIKIGASVKKLGNPFLSEMYTLGGKLPFGINTHLKNSFIDIVGLEPIRANEFEKMEMDSTGLKRMIFTTKCVFVEEVDNIRGISNFRPISKLEYENKILQKQASLEQEKLIQQGRDEVLLAESRKLCNSELITKELLEDYLNRECGMDIENLSINNAILRKLATESETMMNVEFTCSKKIDVSKLKTFCMENNIGLKPEKIENNEDKVIATKKQKVSEIRTHQQNWERLYAEMTTEQQKVHNVALDLLNFNLKLQLATFDDSFDNTTVDKASAEQLDYMVRNSTKQLEESWLEQAEYGHVPECLESFKNQLNDENERLCQALEMQEYIEKLDIDKESFYQLADIYVHNPVLWDEFLQSEEDSIVIKYVHDLQHEMDWKNCYTIMLSKKSQQIYNKYRDELLPIEYENGKTNDENLSKERFIYKKLRAFEDAILDANVATRGQVIEDYVANMEKATSFALQCRDEAIRNFKQTKKRPRDRDELLKWEQDLENAGKNAFFAKYNEVIQKLDNNTIAYDSILEASKVKFYYPYIKHLERVRKVIGKISIMRLRKLHVVL